MKRLLTVAAAAVGIAAQIPLYVNIQALPEKWAHAVTTVALIAAAIGPSVRKPAAK